MCFIVMIMLWHLGHLGASHCENFRRAMSALLWSVEFGMVGWHLYGTHSDPFLIRGGFDSEFVELKVNIGF